MDAIQPAREIDLDGTELDEMRAWTRLSQSELEDRLSDMKPPEIAGLIARMTDARVDLGNRQDGANSAVGRISETAHMLVNGVRASEQPTPASVGR